MAGDRRARPDRRLLHAVEFGDDAARMIERRLTAFRQAHAAPVPLEELHAEFLFQKADLAAEGRLGDAQAPRRLAEAAEVGDVNEGAQLGGFYKV
jgi:hypothetical protein